MTKIRFEESQTEGVLNLVGFTVDENGIVYDENNIAFRDEIGIIHEDEVGGIVPDENGNLTVLRDNFVSILDYVKRTNNE